MSDLRQSLRTHSRGRFAFMSLGLAAALVSISGCTVGPNYQKPETKMPDQWAGTAAAAPAAPSKATPTPPDIRAWWTTFNDSTLNSLIVRASAANLDLRAAEARIRQARAARTIAGSGFWPDVNASASATRSRSGNSTSARTGNLFRAGFDASWEVDIFGGVRRTVEAADADLAAAHEDQRDVLVTLAAEVATSYFQLRGLQQQLVIARRNLALQQNTLSLTRDRQAGGYISMLDVVNAETQVASTSSRIPTLESDARAAIYALAVLLGQQPESMIDELSVAASLPPVPPEIPVGLPSELLRRRPDIRRSEADLHASTARIGIATADLFPRFSLNGGLGLQGNQISALSSVANRFWSIGPSMSVPVFNAGRIRANIEAQEAVRDSTLAAYQKIVLVALQEVETALISYSNEQERRRFLADAVKSSTEAVDLSSQLYTAGRRDFLNVLSAQRSLIDAESALIQSDQQILTDLVSLYKALGGGWDESEAESGQGGSPEVKGP